MARNSHSQKIQVFSLHYDTLVKVKYVIAETRSYE